jgi:phosphoribosyl-ATP pyrophosphohydrolase
LPRSFHCHVPGGITIEAHESLERFEQVHEHGGGDRLSRQAALTVAIVAAFLAIATFLGNESVKEAIQGQTKVSDAHSEQTTFDTQDLVFQSDQALLTIFTKANDQGLAQTSKAVNKEFDKLAKKVPEEQKRLADVVKENKKEVKHANDQHLLFELAEVLLQIAIVLASVAIIARRGFLLMGGRGVAAAGVIILVVGILT